MDKVLGLEDLADLLEKLHEVQTKWYNIGLKLGVSVLDLEAIKNKSVPNGHGDCLREMLIKWLKSGKATPAILCAALRNRIVGEGDLANVTEKEKAVHSTTIKQKKSTAENKDHPPPSITTNPAKRIKLSEDPTAAKPAQDIPHDTQNVQNVLVKKKKQTTTLESYSQDDFIRQQPPDRLCVKCIRVPFNPQRSVCCNRLYCKPCAEKTKKCNDKAHKEVLQYTADKKLSTNVSKLKVKCKNWREGCEWTGELFRLKDHLPQCPKEPIPPASSKQQKSRSSSTSKEPAPPANSKQKTSQSSSSKEPQVHPASQPPRASETSSNTSAHKTAAPNSSTGSHTIHPVKKEVPGLPSNFKREVPHSFNFTSHPSSNIGNYTTIVKKEPTHSSTLTPHPPSTSNTSNYTSISVKKEPTHSSTLTPHPPSNTNNYTSIVKKELPHSSTLTPHPPSSTSINIKKEPPHTPSKASDVVNGAVPPSVSKLTLNIQRETHGEDVNLTPPVHLVMTNVSECRQGKIWISRSFLSHQLGYRLCLAVHIGSDRRIRIGVTLAKGQQNPFLDFPCSGKITVKILHPADSNKAREVEVSFKLDATTSGAQFMPVLTSQCEFSEQLVTKNCLFFQVSKINMDSKCRPWLLGPSYTANCGLCKALTKKP